jgi:excisionase family DNA binding protein
MHTLNITEAAEFLKINPKTAQAMAAKGELPGARIGTCWVFLLEALTEYLKEQTNLQQQQRVEAQNIAGMTPLVERPKQKITAPHNQRKPRKTLPNLDHFEASA